MLLVAFLFAYDVTFVITPWEEESIFVGGDIIEWHKVGPCIQPKASFFRGSVNDFKALRCMAGCIYSVLAMKRYQQNSLVNFLSGHHQSPRRGCIISLYSPPAATSQRSHASWRSHRAAHTSSISEWMQKLCSWLMRLASVRQDLGRAREKMPPMMEVVNFLPIGLVRFTISPVASHGGESLGEELAWWINKTLGLLGWFIAAACHPSFIVSCTPEWSAISFSLNMRAMSMPGRSPWPSQSIWSDTR